MLIDTNEKMFKDITNNIGGYIYSFKKIILENIDSNVTFHTTVTPYRNYYIYVGCLNCTYKSKMTYIENGITYIDLEILKDKFVRNYKISKLIS